MAKEICISNMNLNKILNNDAFSRDEIIYMLNLEKQDEIELLRDAAYSTMSKFVGEKVYFRGLIEFSNICLNDCFYCGIRKSNKNFHRYNLDKDQIIEAVKLAMEFNYGSVVLQSGERTDESFIEHVLDLVKTIKSISTNDIFPEGLGITLCVGEQSKETYQRFFDAGAHRYLLRIESTNESLFKSIHPPELDFNKRMDCLKSLKEIGFQVGTGVMIGLPGQTIENLADDIIFFKEMDVDMIGMGPFIPHKDTQYAYMIEEDEKSKWKNYELALKMIAVTRLVLQNVNMASTTALQAINPFGREEGLRYGANIIMPQLTPTEVRKEYQLYDGKPCMDEFAKECHLCLSGRIASINREIGYGEWGDSKHYFSRTQNEN